MDATTDIEVGLDASGRTVARRMHCEAPLLVRVMDEPGPALTLMLVNGAAGPLGGDVLSFKLRVGPGAHVTVRSVAAAMAQPGPDGEPSTLLVEVSVAAGATLHWAPEPMVSVVGSDHRTTVHLWARSSSTVSMRECISLGRHDESPGRLALRQRVLIDDVGTLDHQTTFGVGALAGPGAHGTGRTITSTVTIGDDLPVEMSEVTSGCCRATFHVSPCCALTTETRG